MAVIKIEINHLERDYLDPEIYISCIHLYVAISCQIIPKAQSIDPETLPCKQA